MCYVEVRSSDDKRRNIDYVDIALRELKRKMKKENVLQDLKRKEYFVKPSEQRKLKKQESIKRKKLDDKKLEWTKNNKI